MSEETVTESPEEFIQAAAESADAPETTKQEKPAGYDQIDFKTASPEEIEARFNRVFGQLKGNQREMSKAREILAQQSKVIDDLSSGVGMVVTHLTDKTYKETEASLEAQMTTAFESGDIRAFTALQNKLTDMKVEQRLSQKQKAQPKPAKQVQQPTQDDTQIDFNDMPPEDARYTKAWGEETDDSGQTLRPWFNNSGTPQDPDPDYVKAVLVATKIFEQYPDRSIQQNLAEVDKRMGVQKTTAGQTVLGGRLQTKPKSSKITLSPEAEKIALRMRFAGPKKSDAEHLQAYRDQIAKVQSTKRG